MSFATVVKGAGQGTEMAIQNGHDQTKKNSKPGLCMSAGIETPGDDDKKRFQRRHFPYKMSSDIFFSDLSSEDNGSSENSVNRENLRTSAGIETRHEDQKISERRHFQLIPEDCMEPGDSARQDEPQRDEQNDSAGVPESTDLETEPDEVDHKKTQRRHFYDKTSSNIFFSGLPQEVVATRNPTNPSDFRKMKG